MQFQYLSRATWTPGYEYGRGEDTNITEKFQWNEREW